LTSLRSLDIKNSAQPPSKFLKGDRHALSYGLRKQRTNYKFGKNQKRQSNTWHTDQKKSYTVLQNHEAIPYTLLSKRSNSLLSMTQSTLQVTKERLSKI